MTQRTIEQFGLIEKIDSTKAKIESSTVTFKWDLYKVIQTSFDSNDFAIALLDPNKDLHLCIIQVWMSYKIKSLINKCHL